MTRGKSEEPIAGSKEIIFNCAADAADTMLVRLGPLPGLLGSVAGGPSVMLTITQEPIAGALPETKASLVLSDRDVGALAAALLAYHLRLVQAKALPSYEVGSLTAQPGFNEAYRLLQGAEALLSASGITPPAGTDSVINLNEWMFVRR